MAAVRPAALELMDRAAVAAVERVKPMGLDADGALLLAQTDGDEVEAEAHRRPSARRPAPTYVASPTTPTRASC